MEVQLKHIMGKKAAFRRIQEEAIKVIIAGKSPVIAVMPIEAGKSMLFILPA